MSSNPGLRSSRYREATGAGLEAPRDTPKAAADPARRMNVNHIEDIMRRYTALYAVYDVYVSLAVSLRLASNIS